MRNETRVKFKQFTQKICELNNVENAGEKFTVEFVAEHHRQFSGWVFKDSVHRQVAFEDLLRVLVVMAVIPDVAQIFHRPALPL